MDGWMGVGGFWECDAGLGVYLDVMGSRLWWDISLCM